MRHPIFTPTAISPDRLDEITVGRHDLIERLEARLRTAVATDARPHTLLVGPRGSGKTHLISVTIHRALRDPAIAQRLVLAWVPEDALSIGSYVDLLVEVIRAIDTVHDTMARRLRQAKDAAGLERLLSRIADGRTVVLVLENLDRIFATIGKAGQGALRGFVETAGSVVILASTPLLFPAIQSRDNAWSGSFDVEHLGDLGLAEGTELLRRAALENGDAPLAEFIGTPTGQGRLRAVAHLAGGSPRLWHILSGCVTVDALDELVPAVEALLDELAPYYQQRLWELPANEQKLVVELGRGMSARTVADLADAVGMSKQGAATSLGRLAQARWVLGTKAPGTDQRTTWYELREPLLRHHLHYRDSRGEPLRFVVEFLRVWYSPVERRRHLAAVEPGSIAEQHLVRTFLEGPRRSDSAWADRDPERLLVEARCWIAQSSAVDRVSGSRDLGTAVEAVVLTAQGRTDLLPKRTRPGTGTAHATAVRAAVDAVAAASGTTADRVGAGVEALARSGAWRGDDLALLTMLVACWNGPSGAAAARDRLDALRKRRPGDDPLALTIRAEHAFFVGQAGDAETAAALFGELVEEYARVFAPDNEDALLARHNLAGFIGDAGDAAAARDILSALVADRTRIVGCDHEDTLRARHDHAWWTGEAGDAAAARDLMAAVAPSRSECLGPYAAETLVSRREFANWTGRAGDATGARDLYAELLDDVQRALGGDSDATLKARNGHAHWVGEAGDASRAAALYADLVRHLTHIYGANNSWTLAVRHSQAAWTDFAGDPVTAQALFAQLLEDAELTLGPTDQVTKNAQQHLGMAALKAGDSLTAVAAFSSLIDRCDSSPGTHQEYEFRARRWLAQAFSTAGDHAAASALLESLAQDVAAVSGAGSAPHMHVRRNLAHVLAAAGDDTGATDMFAAITAESNDVLGDDEAVPFVRDWIIHSLRGGRPLQDIQRATTPARLASAVLALLATTWGHDRAAQLVALVDGDHRVTVVLTHAVMLERTTPESGAAFLDAILDTLEEDARDRLALLMRALWGEPEALAAVPLELRGPLEHLRLSYDERRSRDAPRSRETQ